MTETNPFPANQGIADVRCLETNDTGRPVQGLSSWSAAARAQSFVRADGSAVARDRNRRRHNVGDDEVVCGPARIRFTEDDWDPYNTERRPRGSAILFFQTDDVVTMHAAIKGRGGMPSDLKQSR